MTENLSVKNRSLQEWLGYLEGIDPNRIELGLNRVKVVAAKLNLLKIAAYTIEVAGTNGKGSTAALIAGALNKSGIKTGLYTSPHLHVFTERVNIGGKNVDEALLCKAFYAVYEAAEQGNYTDESWSVFQDALQAAKDVLADEDAAQADVDAALTALNSAYEALEEKPEPEPDVDKDKLQEAVNIYGAIEQGDYTDESWGTFRDALQAAKDILADEDAVQEDVDNALEALNSAYEALEEKTEPEPGDEVDKDKLQTAVDGYKDTEQGSYTDESWEVFQNALQAAQTVLADPDASQEEVDGALIALNSAYAALEETKEPEPEPGDEADKTKLQLVVDGFQSMEQGSYTDASWEAFQNALNNAKDVLADKEASQEEVDAALSALNAAFADLKETSEPTDPDLPGTGTGTGTGTGSGTGTKEPGTDSGDAAADTGDRTNVFLPALMLLLSAGVVFFIERARKRR